MSWVSLALALLKLGNGIIAMVRRRQDIAEGERRAIAAATAEIDRAAGVVREIEAEVDKLTPEEVLRQLEQEGELRP